MNDIGNCIQWDTQYSKVRTQVTLHEGHLKEKWCSQERISPCILGTGLGSSLDSDWNRWSSHKLVLNELRAMCFRSTWLSVGQPTIFFLVCDYVHMFAYVCVKRMENRIIAPDQCVCIENIAMICWKDTLIINFFFCIELSPN